MVCPPGGDRWCPDGKADPGGHGLHLHRSGDRLYGDGLPDRNGGSAAGNSFLSAINRYAVPDSFAPPVPAAPPAEFNALPIIDRLFSSGARSGIRCITEVSVYRQFGKILRIKDMCRHKVAFSMSADDCLMYLGNSNYQKSIGQFAVYNNGGKEIKKLLPYRLEA